MKVFKDERKIKACEFFNPLLVNSAPA